MKTLNFKISEFNISGEDIPEEISDKILKFHIEPMQPIREEMGIAIWPSLKSGYRSYQWEISHSRSGASQHTYGETSTGWIDPKHKGAVDWTCKNFKSNKEKFLQLIIEKTNYTRIAVYNTFIHCDYKATDGKRYLFNSTPSSKWTFNKYV